MPPRREKEKGHRTDRSGPLDWSICLLQVGLGAIGSAATLALAGVLALATVVARFAAALALTGILSLAGVLILKEFGGNLSIVG